MFCFGHYIVLNLFLAILLDNFKQTGKGGGESNFYDEIEKQNDAKEGLMKVVDLVKLILLTLRKSILLFLRGKGGEVEEEEEEQEKEGGVELQAVADPNEVVVEIEQQVNERSERYLMKTSILAMNPAKWLPT